MPCANDDAGAIPGAIEPPALNASSAKAQEAQALPSQVDRRAALDRRGGAERRGAPVEGLAARIIHSIDRRVGGAGLYVPSR